MMTKAVSRRKFLKQGMIAGGSLFLMPLGKLLANGFWEEHAGGSVLLPIRKDAYL